MIAWIGIIMMLTGFFAIDSECYWGGGGLVAIGFVLFLAAIADAKTRNTK